MGLQELILEAIEEFGDPDELVNNEDLIILKLEQECTNKRMLPDDIGLSGDARRLSMNEEAFVTYRAFLGNLRYSAALFAGCSEFASSKAFLETAKYVLKNVRSLVLVHNRNNIFNLVTWFPTVITIVLYHNLRIHTDKGLITSALTSSRMEQLLGTTPALGLDHLSLSNATLQSLLNKCPKLALVMSSEMETALSAKKVLNIVPKRLPLPTGRQALFLGRTCIHYTGIPLEIAAKSAVAVEKAHRHFPEAEHLELTAACESAIGKVASYTKVTHLSLFSAMAKDKSPFEPHVTEVLSVLRLVHLSLSHFSGVRLSLIAKLCPQLKFLGIRVCGVDDEEDTAADFSNLEHLRVGSEMTEESFFKLLRSCPGLRELEIDTDELTTAFVEGPDESCWERPILQRVERLTLRTNTDWFNDCSLDDVEDLPSDLDLTLACLPSLRRVRTDNYDIRLHIKSCFPNIALDWCTCTLCASEFPKIDKGQQTIYMCTQCLKLPRPINYVHIKSGDKKDEQGKTEGSVDTNEEEMKAEISVDTREDKLRVDEVAVDAKDKKMKPEEAAVCIKDEKMKVETLVDSKGEENNAEALVDPKEEEMKAESPTDSKKEIMKAEVVLVDAEEEVKAEEVPVDIKEEKIKAEEVQVGIKQEKLTPQEEIQMRYEAKIRETRRRSEARRRKIKDVGKANNEGGTMTKEEDEVLVPLPSTTKQKVASEAEAGGTNTVCALEPLKGEYKSLEEPD